jgi:conjugal transfer pilus assembly protein TraV
MTNGALPKNSQLAIDKNSTEVATKQGVGALQPVSGAPTPIREPARIMRIWISPWVESSTGDLNWPSYIYTEIEPRKWSFGSLEFNRMHSGIPTMIKQSAAVIPASKPEKQKPEPSVNSPQSNVSEDQKFNE